MNYQQLKVWAKSALKSFIISLSSWGGKKQPLYDHRTTSLRCTFLSIQGLVVQGSFPPFSSLHSLSCTQYPEEKGKRKNYSMLVCFMQFIQDGRNML